MKKHIICIGLCLALYAVGFAQTKEFRFKHLSVQNGLSQSWVKCFLEDHTGLLWIGTGDGLNKFDGKNFTIYKYLPTQARSLNHNNTNVIFEDSRKELWVGTQAGLNYYHRELDEFVPIPFVNNYVTSLHELDKDTLLVGTAGGLCLLNRVDHTSKCIYNVYIEKILKDTRGNIWLATHKGLMLFNPITHSVRSIKFGSGGVDGPIISIFQDSREGIWLGTSTQGLVYFTYGDNDLKDLQFIHFNSNPSDSRNITPGVIYAITEDESHNLWVGVENGGINLLNLDTFKEPFFTKIANNPSDFSSLSNNSIHALYADKQNTIWVGTYAGGVNQYNKLLQRFGHCEAIPGTDRNINDKYVSSILDEDKFLWIGTEKGLNRKNKTTGRWEYFMHNFKDPKSIGSDAVMDIMRDSRNRLWVGTYGGGLNLFDEKTKSFTKFKHDENNPASIGGDNIYQIIESADHLIWVGVMGSGVAVYNPDDLSFRQFKYSPNKNSISSNWVVDLTEDHTGNIWISTTEAVDLLNRKNETFKTFKHDFSTTASINYNGATCLFEDSHNTVWVGTSNGLNYFARNDNSFQHYTVEDGLPNNFIKAITEDLNGNIWFSTNNTITMLNKGTELPKNPKFRSFSVFDDLPSSEFVGRAVERNEKGELYFGSTNGYFFFDPSDIKDNTAVPDIVFTDLRVNNVPVVCNAQGSPLEYDISVTKQLRLSKAQNVFTIGFAALNFIESENNQYAFILEGFDKKWNYVGHQQSATYTNLDPGHYTLRVRASNNDGLWNESGIAMEIVILPAWWQTWLAKFIYAVLFVLAIFFFRKHTIISVNLKNVLWKEHVEKKKSEELTQMKQDFFANVSHEIRTPLTLILGPLNKLIKDEKKIPELEVMYRNSTRLKTLVDQFLDFSKMENKKLSVTPVRTEVLELTKHIMTNFADYAGQKDISMKLETGFLKCVTMLDQDKFEKILTNLLSNALKSITGNGSVVVSLEFSSGSDELRIRVKDTGCGISQPEADRIFERFYSGADQKKNVNGSGIGLYLTRELVELQRGRIHFTSTVGAGSTFCVDLPLPILEIEQGEDAVMFYRQLSEIRTVIGHPENTNQGSKQTILVVDDNEDMCNHVETILCDEYIVVKENNPLKCIDTMISSMPDLVISDVMMPGLDGFQLCKLLKDDIRFSHVPVILLTAKATKNDHISGYEIGADDYVYKPFDVEILKARVRNLITKIEKLKKHFIGHDGLIDPMVQANALDIKFMEDILSAIKENYLNPDFNVNGIIEQMAMSRSLFYKKFKSLSDQSINDLIRNFRLKRAVKLLTDGHLTVSQVAYECGFTDPAYFSRVFKECYKVAPKDFGMHTRIS